MTAKQVKALNKARRVLREIERDAVRASWDADRPAAYGRLAEAASVAGDVLFNVLNTAHAYLSDTTASEGLDAHRAEEKAA